MQKITTHLWFDKEAKEAADFYTSIFPNSKIKSSSVLHDTPSGSVDIVNIELMGHHFSMISAGPYFKFNPSVSFVVGCKTKDEVDQFWQKLSAGGVVLMELSKYPFSEWYGWTQDKYGLSWQVMLVGDLPMHQPITPTQMFVGEQCGRAEEAVSFYTSVFKNTKVDHIMRYEAGEEPDKKGTVKHAGFMLEGQEFAAMDSARMHDFSFNEAISYMVHCKDQAELDYYWNKLSADPAAEQCGWLKDKFGFSWQVVPTTMDEMMEKGTPKQVASVTQAFLKMKKFDLAKLQQAFDQAA
jgi:predicted 3-demethylubiquinone-9 3-methyltransferase (glyoxalase superfamily)